MFTGEMAYFINSGSAINKLGPKKVPSFKAPKAAMSLGDETEFIDLEEEGNDLMYAATEKEGGKSFF